MKKYDRYIDRFFDEENFDNVKLEDNDGKEIEFEQVAVVDYLQLMEPEVKRRDGNKATEVGDISRGLKLLAKDLGVPIIVCSQLSRSSEKEKERKPMLSDLRDSGSIEQDADMVIFLSRDFYGEDPEKANLVDVTLAKNRHGSSGTVQMSWLGQYYKFSTLETNLSEG